MIVTKYCAGIMTVTVLDIETTFKKDNDGKLDVDPYTAMTIENYDKVPVFSST